MQPLPPVKPPEKLPLTTHLTLVSTPDDHGTLVVVMTQMRGDRVTLRKVISDSFLDRNAAMDEFMRLATRIFYFDEAQEFAR